MSALVAGAVLVALGACSGGRSAGDDTGAVGKHRSYADQGVVSKDARRRGPAAGIDGAAAGGTITVYMPGDPGPETLDPTAGSSVTGSSIRQSLTSRSLTQFVRGDDGQSVLVPDLATDLGTPNEDFTKWTFTIRDDARWEDGRPVTADEVAFGICRSLDAGAFPSGSGTEYSRTYFKGAEDYAGPYTGQDPKCEKWGGISVAGQDVTIDMEVPFADMAFLGASAAMGPVPLGSVSDPSRYGSEPLSNGPYKVDSWTPDQELVLVRNDAWSAASDPGRHQYADEFVFKFDQDQSQVDALMLSGNEDSRTALSTAVGVESYAVANDQLGDRLVQQGTGCVQTMTPDYTKITDILVRKALAYAYPYQDAWIAGGEVPGVTRVPASSVLIPGMVGRHDVEVDGEPITFNPGRSRELLAEAGHGDKPYEITMAYDVTDPLAAAVQDQVTKGFRDGGFSVRAIPVQGSPYRVWLDPNNNVNSLLNLRGVGWCSAWPAGSTVLPPLLKGGSAYNTAHFAEPSVDDEMDRIATLPFEDQADAWGALDEKIMTAYFPTIPIAYVNQLFVFGDRVGNPSGDGSMGAPNYKDLFVLP